MKNGSSDSTENIGALRGDTVMYGNGMGNSMAIKGQESSSECAFRLIREGASRSQQAQHSADGGGQAAERVEQGADGDSNSARPKPGPPDVQDRGPFERLKDYFSSEYEPPPPSQKVAEAAKICRESMDNLRTTISLRRDKIVSMSQPPPPLED